MISQEKLEFLGRMSWGIYEIMEIEDMAGGICRHPKNRVEQYIADSFMGFYGCFRPICAFSPELFMESLDTMTDIELTQLLEYFEDNNFELLRVYEESRSNFKTLFDIEIREGRMITFKDFLEFKEPK